MTEHARQQPITSRRVGRYSLYEKLGQGSMGKVYRAMRDGLPRRFALKLVEIDGPKAAESLTRVRREVMALAQFHHPHIVGLIDAFSVNDKCVAIVMDYVNAESFGEQLHLMTPAQVMLVLRQLASAMTVIHDAGVVHRDIKPSNVLVSWPDSKKPHAFLIDFGITRYSEDPDVKESLVGSPAYASPEQFKSNKATTQSDIFSLGAIGFEAITGAPPFSGKNVLEALKKHETWTRPDLTNMLGSAYPEQFRKLIADCLEPDPSKRPKSAHDVLERIDDIMGISSVLSADSSGMFDAPTTEAFAANTTEVETSPDGERIWIDDGQAWFQRPSGYAKLLDTDDQPAVAVAINARYAAAATSRKIIIDSPDGRHDLPITHRVNKLTFDGPLLVGRCDGGVTFTVELDTKRVSMVERG